jgi:hypothetical protein
VSAHPSSIVPSRPFPPRAILDIAWIFRFISCADGSGRRVKRRALQQTSENIVEPQVWEVNWELGYLLNDDRLWIYNRCRLPHFLSTFTLSPTTNFRDNLEALESRRRLHQLARCRYEVPSRIRLECQQNGDKFAQERCRR